MVVKDVVNSKRAYLFLSFRFFLAFIFIIIVYLYVLEVSIGQWFPVSASDPNWSGGGGRNLR